MEQFPNTGKTPNYVLRSDNKPFSPAIEFADPKNETENENDTNCVCVYGFSDKPIYDSFLKSVSQLLTPYPLVKGFLQREITEGEEAATLGHSMRLVVLDAADLSQPILKVATMAAVLRAMQENEKQVPVEYELAYDVGSKRYRLPAVGISGAT